MKEGVKYCFYILFEFVYGVCFIGVIMLNLMFIFDVELLEVVKFEVEVLME